jgi:hypothetical protein
MRKFFIGMDDPHLCHRLPAAFVSVNRLRRRRGPFAVGEWVMDSGAFTTIAKHGGYPAPPSEYAAEIRRWKNNGHCLRPSPRTGCVSPICLSELA